ncbi:MAG TPA: SprT family zinc-dependent metalloprotease, partial [Myxococcota bacterium]|nr:SprT family zinc-dependent metalloprotease [Myxococcota bacterium]
RLDLGCGPIDYVLVRRRGRRGVGLKVDETGLTVSAPATMPLARIEALVRESDRWVLRKIEEWRARRAPPVQWRDGAFLPYLGGSVVLRVACGERSRAELGAGELRATVRDPAEDEVRRVAIAWYKRAAKSLLGERVATLAARAGLAPPRLFVSSALARWGSCNSRREVRLAWRLVKAPPELVDYVVCHELAHLRHMNHSPRFWAEVERQCPGHRELRARLFDTDHLYRSF